MSSSDADISRNRRLQLERLRPAAEDEAVLTPEQALHSIAVELARGNAIAHQALALQEKTTLLVANLVDLTRLGQAAATAAPPAELSESLDRLMGLLEGAMASQVKPAQTLAAEPGKPAPVETEAGGTRATAEPTELED